jgi:hypothetical protein
MRLHFDASLIGRLLDHSEAAESRVPTEDQFDAFSHAPEHVPPGLWLVADHGIYLASNGLPPIPSGAGAGQLIAYAEEADPKRNPRSFYGVKEAAYGPDDGIIFLTSTSVQVILAYARDRRACLNLTPTSLGFGRPSRTSTSAPKSPRRRR